MYTEIEIVSCPDKAVYGKRVDIRVRTYLKNLSPRGWIRTTVVAEGQETGRLVGGLYKEDYFWSGRYAFYDWNFSMFNEDVKVKVHTYYKPIDGYYEVDNESHKIVALSTEEDKMEIELTAFQLLTPGLYTGDKIQVRINYRYECSGILCYTGWQTWIKGKLNGQTMSLKHDIHNGAYGGKDNQLLTFSGLMPNKELEGELIFTAATFASPIVKEIATKSIKIPNLDGMPPNGDEEPPVVCTEGVVRCKTGTVDSEICRSNKWVLHKRDVVACGFVPPEPPTPPTPEEIKEWLEKYKWWILGISLVVTAAVVLLLRRR